MADKKIKPKAPGERTPAAGARKTETAEKVTARRVASKKVAKKVNPRKWA